MIETLKKKFLTRSLFSIIFMIVMGGAFIVMSLINMKEVLTPAVDLNSLRVDEIEDGLRVEGTISAVIDYYAYTEENYQTIEREYIIPIGEEEYMGLVASGSDMNRLENIMYMTQDYIEGDDDAMDNIEPLFVEGTIRKITGESKEFYHEYLSESGWSDEEIDQYFLPYAVMVGDVRNSSMGGMAIFVVLGLVAILIGVITLIRCLAGSTVKQVKKYCNASPNPEMAKQKLDSFYECTPEVNGIRVSKEFLLVTKGMNAQFCEVKDIVWVYQHVVKFSAYFIPVAKTYSIMVMKADGNRMEITMSGRKKSEATMEHIAKTLPFIYVGHNIEIERAYSKNRQEMIAAVAERRKEFMGLEM